MLDMNAHVTIGLLLCNVATEQRGQRITILGAARGQCLIGHTSIGARPWPSTIGYQIAQCATPNCLLAEDGHGLAHNTP